MAEGEGIETPDFEIEATATIDFSWRAKCIPVITNSLSSANSEFTFSNNLRLNTSQTIREK